MNVLGRAKRVRIYLGADDRVGHRPAHLAVLELLRRENAQGATVYRAMEGFGATGEVHTGLLADVAWKLPVVVEWIDRAEEIEQLAPRVLALVTHGLVTVDDTDVLLHAPHAVRALTPAVTAADLMSREVVSVSPATPVRDVVELTLGKLYRAVPVVEEGRPVGIVTSSDLVERGGLGVRLDLLTSLEKPELHALLERLAEQRRTARDVMTSPVVTVHEHAPAPEIAARMVRRRLKRLPVVDGSGALVGVVSRLDLLRRAAGGLGEAAAAAGELGLAGDAPLASVMRRDAPTVHPETPLAEVIQAVISTRLNRALVVDASRKVVGVVTDAELLERVTPAARQGALRSLVNRLPFIHPTREDLAAAHARGKTAGDLMSRELATARGDARVSDAIAAMLPGRQKVLAVTDGEGHLLGVVDRADLLHALVPGSPHSG